MTMFTFLFIPFLNCYLFFRKTKVAEIWLKHGKQGNDRRISSFAFVMVFFFLSFFSSFFLCYYLVLNYRFDKVPLVTPNGDILIPELSFEVCASCFSV
jgi:hypothetical protein